MAASDKFKEELENNNFVGALKTALSEAIELEIVTWVVPAEQDNLGKHTPENALPGHLMRTRINLVDGDIENEMGSLFVGSGPYTELRQFHLEQVQRGQDIIQRNLMNTKQLFEILVEKIHRLPQTERQVTPSEVTQIASSSWPSESQQAALLTEDDQLLEEDESRLVDDEILGEDDSRLVSSKPLIDDEMLEEPDPALVPGNPQNLWTEG